MSRARIPSRRPQAQTLPRAPRRCPPRLFSVSRAHGAAVSETERGPFGTVSDVKGPARPTRAHGEQKALEKIWPLSKRVRNGFGKRVTPMGHAESAFTHPRAPSPARGAVAEGGAPGVLSRTLWDLDWAAHLPHRLTEDGVTVFWSSFDEALPFIRDHYAEIFHEGDGEAPFATREGGAAKARYYRAAGDFFEIKHEGRTVGLLIGTPVDWSTYYLRSAAAIPEYQGRKVCHRFFPRLFELLKGAGVHRVEADTSPANMATMHLLTRMRFNVTGTLMTERWGAHVHLTKFLDEDAESTFLRHYCSGVKYQLRERG